MIFIILAIIVVIALWVIATYNNLVSSKVKVDNSFSQIDVQLQRRFDLIPNLVECVKGYMEHESDVLTKVTELRTSWASAGSVSEKVEIDNQLSGALKTINGLQQDLKDTENKISYARQFYNDAVTRYNRNLMVFPSNIIASMFHFTPATLFAVDSAEAKQNVKVDFGK